MLFSLKLLSYFGFRGTKIIAGCTKGRYNLKEKSLIIRFLFLGAMFTSLPLLSKKKMCLIIKHIQNPLNNFKEKCYLNLSWPQKLITIHVNHVVRHLREPYFCFPSNLLRKLLVGFEVQERCDKYHSSCYSACH